ncbi:MAG: winged helix-turn-helix domain-containing protein [Desulfovibrionaceae bacterium]
MLEKTRLRFKLRIWLECDEGFSLGPGKAELLQGIEARGSLSGAAEALGMSYRRAWGRIKKMEASLGRPLVEKLGGNKAGYRLTPFAVQLVRGYEAWIAAVEEYAVIKAEECIPLDMAMHCAEPK